MSIRATAVAQFPFVRLGWLHNQKMLLRALAAIADLVRFSDHFGHPSSASSVFADDAVGPATTSHSSSTASTWNGAIAHGRAKATWLYGACDAIARPSPGRRTGVNGAGPDVSLIVHSPLRLYYMTRNRIALYRRSYVPLKWKLKDVLRMCAKLISILIFLAPRRRYLSMSVLAARDALRGASGAFNAAARR